MLAVWSVQATGSVDVGTYDAIAMMQEVAEKNGWTKFVSMQPEYSLIYREEVSASVQFIPQKLKK
jgi:aryl-alcohol dehydrogenase-like predicted oxidoreductase